MCALSISLIILYTGQPIVTDSTLHLTCGPSGTLQVGGRRVVLSALSRLTSDGVAGYGFGVRGTLRAGTSLPNGLLARLDTDRSLRRGGFAFGFSLGAADMAGLVATTPADVNGIDALSLYGVSTRRFTSARRSKP